MKNILPIILNAVFVVSFYFGFVENVSGARNIAVFYIWAMIVVVFLTVMNQANQSEEQKIKDAARPQVIPRSIHTLIQFAVIGGLVWNGWWITVIFYIISVALVHKMWEEKDKLKTKIATEQAIKF